MFDNVRQKAPVCGEPHGDSDHHTKWQDPEGMPQPVCGLWEQSGENPQQPWSLAPSSKIEDNRDDLEESLCGQQVNNK